MFARILSGALAGFEPLVIEVEVVLAGGLPAFALVGLPDAAVNEARERIRAALAHAGHEMPARRITVNLAPADVKKEGSGLDVPIAVGILTASEVLSAERVRRLLFVGEMSLDGRLRHTRGILPLALLAKDAGFDGLVLPAANQAEAAAVPGLSVHPFETLADLVAALSRPGPLPTATIDPRREPPPGTPLAPVDLAEIKGQFLARRALEICAAGGHNLAMVGPPGAGKTLLARALPSILPPLSFEEAIDVTRVFSIKGLLPEGGGMVWQRPFRDPHHTISDVALVGGGRIPAPGEVSLAHHGVLFLDELPEFRKTALEVLREPLSEGRVSIARAAQAVSFPARFLLVAAMNPCPCGFATDPHQACRCTPGQVQSYQQKLSGPLLDRIDLQIGLPRLKPEELVEEPHAEPSAPVLQRVMQARARQRNRHPRSTSFLNAHLPMQALRAVTPLPAGARRLLLSAARAFNLSARGYDKVLRVARTVADLAGVDQVTEAHIAEAVQYRTLDPFQEPPLMRPGKTSSRPRASG